MILQSSDSRLDGEIFGTTNRCFACGPRHPFGFHLEFRVEGEEVVTDFTPLEAHEGVPTVMHGGLVTTLADEIGGWALIALREKFGFTGTMKSRFSLPVRIGRTVHGRGRITRENARIVHVAVRLLQDGVECFSSEMMFVILDEQGAEKMMGGPLPESWKKFLRTRSPSTAR